jgi:hypothetical protein
MWISRVVPSESIIGYLNFVAMFVAVSIIVGLVMFNAVHTTLGIVINILIGDYVWFLLRDFVEEYGEDDDE